MASLDRETLLKLLCECGKCAWEDLHPRLGPGDKREARKMLADLIREGLVVKEVDYERRKLLYKPVRCPTESS